MCVHSGTVRFWRTAYTGAMVTTWWIVLGGGAAAALLLATSWVRRRDRDVDLGNVSDQWIAEQRMGQGHDTQR